MKTEVKVALITAILGFLGAVIAAIIQISPNFIPDKKEDKSNTTKKSKNSNDDDLSSAKDVDYTRLRNLLRELRWEEADKETGIVMLKAAEREKERNLDYKAIENFPCTDLRTINRLWVKYSKGHFGFSVQKQIFLEVGGVLGISNSDVYDKIQKNLGWDDFENIKKYNILHYDAPKGFLPGELNYYVWLRYPRPALEQFLARVDACDRLVPTNLDFGEKR